MMRTALLWLAFCIYTQAEPHAQRATHQLAAFSSVRRSKGVPEGVAYLDLQRIGEA